MQRHLMHLVERAIHQTGKRPLDEQAFAQEEAHQAADRAQAAERHQRAEIAIEEGLERLTLEAPSQLPEEMRGLLMGRLGAWRHRRVVALARGGGAVADREA